LLVLVGGLAGVGLAAWGIDILKALGPVELPRLDTVTMDGRVMSFAAGVSVLTGVLFGMAPALTAARSGLSATVRPAGYGGSHGSRSLLVVGQFGLALMLVAGAGLAVRSFVQVQALDPGFDPSAVLSMTVSVTSSPAGRPSRRASFYREAVAAVEALPGVESASLINHLPLAGDAWGRSFRIEGRPEPQVGSVPNATYRVVAPGYFATMGIPIVRGRDISEADAPGAEPVAIVSEYFAERHWPGEDALGRRFTLLGGSGEPEWLRVVGIARNTAREDWLEPQHEEMYLPLLQSPEYLESPASHYAYMTLVARTSGDPDRLSASVREAIWDIESGVPISDVQTMASVVARATAGPRFYMFLLSTFAVAAIALAAVGVYGVVSVMVAERRREIGIRLALGARPARVVRLFVGRGLMLALGGAAAGFAGSLLLSGTMGAIVYGIAPNDPATFGAVAVLLMTVGVLACYLPARRATRVDALTALRDE